MKWLAILAAVIVLGLAGIVLNHDKRQTGSSGGGAASSQKVATISHGESVTIEDYLTDGVFTVIEFTADW